MKLLMLFFLSVFLFGCANSGEVSMDKLDAALKQKISEYKNNGIKEEIRFIGICNKEINEQTRQDIKSTGVIVNSVSKDIFTGRGNYNSILKLSGKDYLTSLRAPREVKIQSSN